MSFPNETFLKIYLKQFISRAISCFATERKRGGAKRGVRSRLAVFALLLEEKAVTCNIPEHKIENLMS
jgi:hypothetical protein